MIRFAVAIFILLGMPASCSGLAAPVTSPNGTLQIFPYIINKTLERHDALHQALLKMQYDQTARLEELDDHGAVLHHELLRMVVRPGANPTLQIVSDEGDRIPATPDEAAAQTRGRDVEDTRNTLNLRELVDRFTLTPEGKDLIGGQRTYVIAFQPKPDQPYRDETEKVVNQLHGRLWISEKTYDVLQIEASLARPVSITWFLATIPMLNFNYRMSAEPDGFGSSQIQITLQVRAPLAGFHQRQTIEVTHFGPRTMDTSALLARPAAEKYFSDPTIGGYYTNPKAYPNIYSFSEKSWLWYQAGSGNPHYFYNYTTKEWETH